MKKLTQKEQNYIQCKYVAFVNHFKKVADPNGFIWLLTSGRLASYQEAEILKAIGERYNKDTRQKLIESLNFYGKFDFTTSIVDNKPQVNKRLKALAEKHAKELVERYPLYQPKQIGVKECQ